MARTLVELFRFHRGVRPVYATCRFDELSRGFVLCLLNTSYKKQYNSSFYNKIDDHGIQRGETGRIIAQWRRSVASRIALDLPYWSMRSALYHLIRMAIELACEAGACFSVVNFMGMVD
jgi:hypothetical protein